MLIDWFTVGAQAVNFLILVWLLKRFLYRPVLAAMDAREKKIAGQLAQAAQREAQATAERDDFQHRRAALESEREGLLRKATEEAAAERHRLMEAARQDAEALRSRLGELLTHEREELRRRLASQTQTEVLALTRKVLSELAGIAVEERMVEVFLEHLRALPDDQRRLVTANTSAAMPVAVVHSAFELSLPRRTAIKAAIGESLGPGMAVRFELSPELVSGIELTVGGVKLAWSITDYLTSLSEKLMALITPAPGASPATSTAAEPPTPAPAPTPSPSLGARHG